MDREPNPAATNNRPIHQHRRSADSTDMSAEIHPANSLIRAFTQIFTDRSFRVIVLISLIAVMSMIDLYLTILYITSTGMNEINPIARAMMEYQSPTILGLWKAATVVLGVGILAIIRRKKSAECGAWIGCLILGMLMTHWVAYIQEQAQFTDGPIAMDVMDAMGESSWIYMGTDLVGPSSATP